MPARRPALGRGDEGRADIGQIRPQELQRSNLPAFGDTAGHRDDAVEELADLRHEREGVEPSGVPARPRRQQHQAVRASRSGLLRMTQARHVREDQATVVMYRSNDRIRSADAGDHQRRTMAHNPFQIFGEALVGFMHDQVGRPGRAVARTGRGDLRQPVVQRQGRPGVERRKPCSDPGPAGGNDQLGPRNQEHRRADDRHSQASANFGPQRVWISEGTPHGGQS